MGLSRHAAVAVSQIDTSWGTHILSRPGGDSCCRKRKTETGCVQESAGCDSLGGGGTNREHGHHQVRVLVLSASNGNVASRRTYCLFVVCVWIIEDMHTYPKLNSVAVLGRTKNAYWQSQFLCSSSSLHNTPGSQQNTEQVDTSKLLRTPDLLCF